MRCAMPGSFAASESPSERKRARRAGWSRSRSSRYDDTRAASVAALGRVVRVYTVYGRECVYADESDARPWPLVVRPNRSVTPSSRAYCQRGFYTASAVRPASE